MSQGSSKVSMHLSDTTVAGPVPEADVTEIATEMSVVSEEERYRANAYRLLATLLRTAPDQTTLNYLAALPDSPADNNENRADSDGRDRNVAEAGEDELLQALIALGDAARQTVLSTELTAAIGRLDDEFHALFVGLSRGELVPYGSWYQSGFLMEKPLGELRGDLRRLGIERASQSHEPEDHVAAVLETVALLIETSASHTQQLNFFQQHIDPWIERFFTDLATAPSADFYRQVAGLGRSFMRFESAYLRL